MKNVSIADDPKAEEKLLKIARAIDEFKGYADGHAVRVAGLADALAVKFNFAGGERSPLRCAALIRDIGERAMNREYIKSTGALNDAERIDSERHPVIGEQESAKYGLSRAVQLLVRWHHEWWNGDGYPDALCREDIPLAARILRVSDTFAALTANRPYRAALSADEAKRYLIENTAVEFDPKVVAAFLLIEDLKETEVPAETTAN